MSFSTAKKLHFLTATFLHFIIAADSQNSTQPFVGSGHVKPEDAELKRLQRENRELREEVEILKKAAAYFAKNQK